MIQPLITVGKERIDLFLNIRQDIDLHCYGSSDPVPVIGASAHRAYWQLFSPIILFPCVGSIVH